MRIPVSIRTNYSKADIKALVDSGATNNFIRPGFAERMGLGTKPLDRPKKIWNVDNTENKAGCITHYTDLDVQTKGIHKQMRFLVTDIGNEDILLGYPWLATYNPEFSWQHATIHEDALPVIIRSTNPRIERIQPIIAAIRTDAPPLTQEEKDDAYVELQDEC